MNHIMKFAPSGVRLRQCPGQWSRWQGLVWTFLFAVIAWGAAGCSGDDPGEIVDDRPKGPDIVEGVKGTIQFQKRIVDAGGCPPPETMPPILRGLSSAADAELRVARFIVVEAIDVGGALISRTTTDVSGQYGIGGTFPDGFQILAYPNSPADSPAMLPVIVRDSSGTDYAVASDAQTAVNPGDLVIVNVLATVTSPLRVAGAFNIVDVIQKAAEIWRDSTGIQPGMSEVRWETGVSGGTFFSPSTNRISLVGGTSGAQDSTDTDEFDDVVVAHEYMHFLQQNHVHSSSPGGPHSGENLVPNLAFEEGLADWFGTLVGGTSLYLDTFGNKDGVAQFLICDDLETSTLRRVEGVGSEQSVYELIWDIVDGTAGIADVDGDGVAVTPDRVLSTLSAMDPRADYLYIGLLIQGLVDRGALSAADAQSVLNNPVDHDISFPLQDRDNPSSGRDVFPVPVSLDQPLSGSVDARNVPAGGLNVTRGFNSSRYYRLVVNANVSAAITLTINGSGSGFTDLDLFLLTVTNGSLGSSQGESAIEVIEAALAPGVYIIEIRGYSGNLGRSASYTLEVKS